MPRKKGQLTYAHVPPAPIEEAVLRLGSNIATARLRRRWRQSDLAAKAGITRNTLAAIEKGKLGTGIGAYVAALWALGLADDIKQIAAPERDLEGITLEAARSPVRADPPRMSDDF